MNFIKNNEIHLNISKENIVEYYLDQVDLFQKRQTNKIPYPYMLLDKIFFNELKHESIKKKKTNHYSSRFRDKYNDHISLNEIYYGLNILIKMKPEEDYLFPHCFTYEFDTDKNINNFTIDLKGNFFEPIHKHWNEPVLKYEKKILKTKNKHIFSINNSNCYTKNKFLKNKTDRLVNQCRCDPEYFHPISSTYTSVLIYICGICGKFYLCDCFKECENDIKSKLKGLNKRYFSKLNFKQLRYKNNICHVCRGKVPPPIFMHKMYGSFFMTRYAPWVYKSAYINNHSYKSDPKSSEIINAENQLREQLGIFKIGEKWKNETILYKTILSYFGDKYEIIHHARPKFLGLQEYDVFIPKLKVAFEYDGAQHSKPIEYFGGEEGYKKTLERDKRKNKISKENNILLIRVNEGYSEEKLLKIISKREKDIL